MSGVKHTPGPWEAREVRTQVGRAFRIGAGEMLEAGKGCCIIYDDYCGNPENERKANARLIAAAPDLLEALEGLRGIMDRAESNASGNPEWEVISRAITTARNAIDRARGRGPE